ncbi:MAG: shikimate dehydrogenase [Eubacteriales bacterium]|nr:shikimate dehydrogenase [Eubacteriales bacterium]
MTKVYKDINKEGMVIMCKYEKATQPTIYFIGVTTGSSSIMKVFPRWAKALGLKDAVIKGIDFKPHSPAEEYREAVEFIKEDPLSLGALVTTHKIDLYNSCKDLFDYIDPFADQLGEISCISKLDGEFRAHAKDPISSGLALEAFVPEDYWKDYGGEVLLLGAGGASLAMSVYFTQKKFGDNVPVKITIANRSLPRLKEAEKILSGLNEKTTFNFVLNPTPEDNDKTLAALPPHSLIVNATGLGKDGPGSPLTDNCQFPKDSLVWEINYRGDLVFKDQAEAQQQEKNLLIEDGWVYFIHGWTQVVSEVFHTPIEGEVLDNLSEIAKN